MNVISTSGGGNGATVGRVCPSAPHWVKKVARRAGTDAPYRLIAFTLIELLVVISIVGLLAGLAVPVINNFKPNVVEAATRQLLDDVHHARQLAISQRTPVFMIFVPTNFWSQGPYVSYVLNDPVEKAKGAKLYDKQLIAYNFVTLRSLGDQPGQQKARYLSKWKTLPEGVFIAQQKFGPRKVTSPLMITNNYFDGNPPRLMPIVGFNTTNGIPFPSEDTVAPTYVALPYIEFDYTGQLVPSKNDPVQNEYIPLTKGSVLFQHVQGNTVQAPPSVQEAPVGNTSNAFNIVSIEWLTGRAHLERQKVQ